MYLLMVYKLLIIAYHKSIKLKCLSVCNKHIFNLAIVLDKTRLMEVVVALLQPVVRFCLSHGMRIQDFIECAKAAFVFEGQVRPELGPSTTASRLSTLTGLQRREVNRFCKRGLTGLSQPKDLFSKVLGTWQTKERFITKSGQPRLLSFGFTESEFSNLVSSLSTDISPASVLAELERVQAIERSADGTRIRLRLQSYVPKNDISAGMNILAQDLEDFISAVEENLFEERLFKNLHVRTQFDRVRAENLDELRAWLLREGHELHERARRYLARLDQDISPDTSYRGQIVHVVLGSYSRIREKSDD